MDLGAVFVKKRYYISCPTFDKRELPALMPREANYVYKAGIALLDLGRIGYDQSKYSADIVSLKPSTYYLDLNSFFKGMTSLNKIHSKLDEVANLEKPADYFTISLPTRFQIQFDWNVSKGFYLNALTSFSVPELSYADFQLKEAHYWQLTPRWESMLMGVYLPVSSAFDKKLFVGGGFRFGPVFMGVQDLGSVFSKKEKTDAGVYFGFKTFILPKKEKPVCGFSPYGSLKRD